MKPFHLAKIFTLAAVASLTIVSCNRDKDDDSNAGDAIALSIASGTSSTIFDDAFDVVLQDGENNNVGRGPSCATITISPADPAVYPKTMTIDFGTGCTSSNGVTRKGKLIATLSGRIRTTGSVVGVTFDNYYVNNYKVEGNFSITNNSTGNGLNFTTQTTNGKVTYPNGTTWYNYAGTHTVVQTAGAGTITFTDDNFSVTGNSTTTSGNNSLAVTISTPLVKNASCRNIVSGVQSFTYNNLSGTLNYGDGACDNQALLTIGAYTQMVTLPR